MAQSGDITEALRLDNYFGPAVNAADGSVWASYVAAGDCIASSECGLAHLAVDGTEVCSRTGFGNILGLSVNAADGSCWVADGGVCNTQPSHGSVVHVGPEGTVLWRSAGYNCPQAISVNPVDGSCWVADRYGAEAAYPPSSRIVHLAANGDELSSTEGFGDAWSVSVNPTDGSCWVSDTGHGQLVLLSSTGVEIGARTIRASISSRPIRRTTPVGRRTTDRFLRRGTIRPFPAGRWSASRRTGRSCGEGTPSRWSSGSPPTRPTVPVG